MASHRISSVFRKNLFKNKVAIVTGGGSGIGNAITCELLYLGCNVMIASRSVDRLVTAIDNIKVKLPYAEERIKYAACNIREPDEVHSLMKQTIHDFGKIDMLVNNAGGQFAAPAANYNLKGWNTVIDLNLNGTFHCIKEVYHQWMEEHGGVIVNIIADMYKGMPLMSHSGAARAGVENLTKSLAVEWANNGIRLNCVLPGSSIWSPTAEANYGDKGIFDMVLPTIPLGRFGRTEEVSSAVCYLLSPAAAFVTGATLVVDGGGWLFNGRFPPKRDNNKPYNWDEDVEEEETYPKSKL